MLRCLSERFAFEGPRELAVLDAASLAGLDVLILCTTEGPALSADELAALCTWLAAGGSLITSAFANWSAYEHYARDTVGFLGLETQPRTRFLPRLTHSLDPPAESQCRATRRLLEHGVFGAPRSFRNVGESFFTVQPDALAKGAVQLVTRAGSSGQDLQQHKIATLVFFPPKPLSDGGVTGAGQCLVCSNLHWLADPSKWNGGTFQHGPDQAWLFLNFVAAGVAARVGRVTP